MKRLIYCSRLFRRMHQPLDAYDTIKYSAGMCEENTVYNTHIPEWECKIKQFIAVKLFFHIYI